MNKNDWMTSVECHLCKIRVPTRESLIIEIKAEFLGVKGYINVRVCKECYRESQLNKLI